MVSLAILATLFGDLRKWNSTKIENLFQWNRMLRIIFTIWGVPFQSMPRCRWKWVTNSIDIIYQPLHKYRKFVVTFSEVFHFFGALVDKLLLKRFFLACCSNEVVLSQWVMLLGFCRYQNGKHGEHGADVLRLVETEQEEEQDHAQMDRVALASMKTEKYAMWLNVPVRKQIATNMFALSNTIFYCT